MKNILIVEDDPFLIDIYGTKLKEAGFAVDFATDGEEALEKLEEKIPDLIILDIVLPRTDGWEFLKKVKLNERLKTVPVIILSNLGQKEEVEKGLKLGAAKYLIKAHYAPEEALKEIKKTLDNNIRLHP